MKGTLMHKRQLNVWTRPMSVVSLIVLACSIGLVGLSTSRHIPSASAQTTTKGSMPTLIPNSKKYRVSGLQPATGRSGSSSLTVRALLGKDGKTNVEATTGELDSTATPPGNINKVQLKPLNQDGEAMYARNFNGLTGGGYFRTTVDLARGKQVQVQTNIGGIDPKRTDVVTIVETVKLRPDLAASNLTLPDKAVVNTPVKISAVIREINADAGATANCGLYVDGVKVDQVDGIWVDANGTVSAAFTHTFPSVGAKRIEVKIENVVPGDYDVSNNAVYGSVEVIQPGSRLNYYAEVYDYDFFNKGKNYYDQYYNGLPQYQYAGEWDQKGWYQGSYMYGYTPHAVTFPLNATLTESNDGETVSSASFSAVPYYDNSWSDGTYQWTQKCTNNFDSAASAYFSLCTTSQKEIATGNVVYGTWFDTARYSGDIVYYSQGFNRAWYQDGTLAYSYSWNDSGHSIFGPARQSFGSERGINLSITSGDGAVHTASPVITLQPYNQAYQQPYTCYNWNNGYGWYGSSCWEQDYSSIGKVGYASESGNP